MKKGETKKIGKANKTASVRTIDVRPGDVFNPGTFAMLVFEIVGDRARVRCARNGRRSVVQVRRLQQEYARCGENETRRVQKKIAQLDAEKSK